MSDLTVQQPNVPNAFENLHDTGVKWNEMFSKSYSQPGSGAGPNEGEDFGSEPTDPAISAAYDGSKNAISSAAGDDATSTNLAYALDGNADSAARTATEGQAVEYQMQEFLRELAIIGSTKSNFVEPTMVMGEVKGTPEAADADYVLEDGVLGAFIPEKNGGGPGGTIVLQSDLVERGSAEVNGQTFTLNEVMNEELGEAIGAYATQSGIKIGDGDVGSRIADVLAGDTFDDDSFEASELDKTTVYDANGVAFAARAADGGEAALTIDWKNLTAADSDQVFPQGVTLIADYVWGAASEVGTGDEIWASDVHAALSTIPGTTIALEDVQELGKSSNTETGTATFTADSLYTLIDEGGIRFETDETGLVNNASIDLSSVGAGTGDVEVAPLPEAAPSVIAGSLEIAEVTAASTTATDVFGDTTLVENYESWGYTQDEYAAAGQEFLAWMGSSNPPFETAPDGTAYYHRDSLGPVGNASDAAWKRLFAIYGSPAPGVEFTETDLSGEYMSVFDFTRAILDGALVMPTDTRGTEENGTFTDGLVFSNVASNGAIVDAMFKYILNKDHAGDDNREFITLEQLDEAAANVLGHEGGEILAHGSVLQSYFGDFQGESVGDIRFSRNAVFNLFEQGALQRTDGSDGGATAAVVDHVDFSFNEDFFSPAAFDDSTLPADIAAANTPHNFGPVATPVIEGVTDTDLAGAVIGSMTFKDDAPIETFGFRTQNIDGVQTDVVELINGELVLAVDYASIPDPSAIEYVIRDKSWNVTEGTLDLSSAVVVTGSQPLHPLSFELNNTQVSFADGVVGSFINTSDFGHDDVTFTLSGENAEYFEIGQATTGNKDFYLSAKTTLPDANAFREVTVTIATPDGVSMDRKFMIQIGAGYNGNTGFYVEADDFQSKVLDNVIKAIIDDEPGTDTRAYADLFKMHAMSFTPKYEKQIDRGLVEEYIQIYIQKPDVKAAFAQAHSDLAVAEYDMTPLEIATQMSLEFRSENSIAALLEMRPQEREARIDAVLTDIAYFDVATAEDTRMGLFADITSSGIETLDAEAQADESDEEENKEMWELVFTTIATQFRFGGGVYGDIAKHFAAQGGADALASSAATVFADPLVTGALTRGDLGQAETRINAAGSAGTAEEKQLALGIIKEAEKSGAATAAKALNAAAGLGHLASFVYDLTEGNWKSNATTEEKMNTAVDFAQFVGTLPDLGETALKVIKSVTSYFSRSEQAADATITGVAADEVATAGADAGAFVNPLFTHGSDVAIDQTSDASGIELTANADGTVSADVNVVPETPEDRGALEDAASTGDAEAAEDLALLEDFEANLAAGSIFTTEGLTKALADKFNKAIERGYQSFVDPDQGFNFEVPAYNETTGDVETLSLTFDDTGAGTVLVTADGNAIGSELSAAQMKSVFKGYNVQARVAVAEEAGAVGGAPADAATLDSLETIGTESEEKVAENEEKTAEEMEDSISEGHAGDVVEGGDGGALGAEALASETAEGAAASGDVAASTVGDAVAAVDATSGVATKSAGELLRIGAKTSLGVAIKGIGAIGGFGNVYYGYENLSAGVEAIQAGDYVAGATQVITGEELVIAGLAGAAETGAGLAVWAGAAGATTEAVLAVAGPIGWSALAITAISVAGLAVYEIVEESKEAEDLIDDSIVDDNGQPVSFKLAEWVESEDDYNAYIAGSTSDEAITP